MWRYWRGVAWTGVFITGFDIFQAFIGDEFIDTYIQVPVDLHWMSLWAENVYFNEGTGV
jgi:hypothetical protein